MKSEQVIQRLSTTPEASIENLQEHRYWLQCERAYTYQPIYRTDGRLMAIEILTVVTHPQTLLSASRRIAILPKLPFASAWTCWKSSFVCWRRSSPFSNSTISSPR